MCGSSIQATQKWHEGKEGNIKWKHGKLCGSEYSTNQTTLQPSQYKTSVTQQATVSATLA